MPATSIEDWLHLGNRANIPPPPHRCKRVIREWTTGDKANVKCRADDGTIQTHRLVAMSSLSRRACYKCGNVGHYAEVCSSAERLCYNCKQPGMLLPMQVSAPTFFFADRQTQDTNPTNVLSPVPRRQSSATTAKGSDTSRLIALLSV